MIEYPKTAGTASPLRLRRSEGPIASPRSPRVFRVGISVDYNPVASERDLFHSYRIVRRVAASFHKNIAGLQIRAAGFWQAKNT